eukprot:5399516-Prymnesium_polylepis.2
MRRVIRCSRPHARTRSITLSVTTTVDLPMVPIARSTLSILCFGSRWMPIIIAVLVSCPWWCSCCT